MPTLVNRAKPLNAWSMYDWGADYKYAVGQFATVTFTGQTQTTAQCTVTLTGSPAEIAGSQVGLLWGPYNGGYDRKTRLVPGAGAVIGLRELKANTVYHCAAYAIDGLGVRKIGGDTLLTTAP